MAEQPSASNMGVSNHISNITSIEKLEGLTNYSTWKFAIKMLLTLEGLWQCVQGTHSDVNRDDRALARICLSLQPALYQYVRGCATAKEAWQKLADCFEDKGLYRRVLLLRQLHRIDYSHYSSISEYIDGAMKLVQQLADIGKIIDNAEVAEILLSGLPQDYDVVVSSLETACLTSSLSSEMVRMRLLQEDHRRKTDTNSTAYVSNKKKSLTLICGFCKRKGHTENRCFKKKREQKLQKEKEHTTVASAFSANAANDFIIDSGASCHMVSDSSIATDAEHRTNDC